MYIRRDCLDIVGAMREDVFAQGYGEENDFCIRASHAGWRHVAAPGIFVTHLGSRSFGAAKAYLVERNLKILNTLHPGYDKIIEDFQRADPMAESRRRLDMARWRKLRTGCDSVLLVTHARSGGVQTHIGVRATALRARGLRPIVVWPADNRFNGYDCVLGDGLEGGTPNLRFAIPNELELLANFLTLDQPIWAEVHHLVGHDHRIMDLITRLDVPYDMIIHDYASFCPRISLVNGTGQYCGEPDVDGCEACIADYGYATSENIPVRKLLARSEQELACAERVIVPSADVADRIRRHFPALRPKIIPWEPEPDQGAHVSKLEGLPARICLVGALGVEKGYNVLLGCARDAAARNLALEFVLVGFSMDNNRLLDTGRVCITGRYEEIEVAPLIRAQHADIGWIGSIWPETWSYTLTHLWQCGLDVAAFDLGAPAERINRTKRGWLIPLGCGFAPINDLLLQFVKSTRKKCRT